MGSNQRAARPLEIWKKSLCRLQLFLDLKDCLCTFRKLAAKCHLPKRFRSPLVGAPDRNRHSPRRVRSFLSTFEIVLRILHVCQAPHHKILCTVEKQQATGRIRVAGTHKGAGLCDYPPIDADLINRVCGSHAFNIIQSSC